MLLATILVVSRAARAEVVCGYTVNSNPGPGEGFFKYTPCEDSEQKVSFEQRRCEELPHQGAQQAEEGDQGSLRDFAQQLRLRSRAESDR
jgi:hypothetical protein